MLLSQNGSIHSLLSRFERMIKRWNATTSQENRHPPRCERFIARLPTSAARRGKSLLGDLHYQQRQGKAFGALLTTFIYVRMLRFT